MGLWSFVRPEATTNYITNPSLEEATTGYTASGGSIARSADKQTKGLYSLEVTPSGGVNDGVYYALSLTAYVEHTFSVDVWGVSGIPYRIYFYDVTAASILGTPVEFTGDGTWRRYQVSATLGANTNVRVYVVKNNHANTAEFYIDALQVEAKGYATTYCDGDEEGCEWAAGSHTSTSSRSAQSAAGGRVIDLDDDDYAFEVEQSVGVGMPPMEIIDTLPAQSDGGDYQRTIARPRSFELIETLSEASKADYHTSRLNLIKAFNPHRLASDQPVRVRYSLSGRSVEIAAYYEGGLEKGALLSPSVERMALRLRAEEPLFREVTGHNVGDSCGGQGAMAATVRDTLSSVNYILARDAAGNWTNMNGGTVAASVHDVRSLVLGLDGLIYAAGSYTFLNGGSTAANRAGAWDGAAWAALGTGLNNTASAVAVGPSGLIYYGGTFTTAGGGSANRITTWNGSAWGTLGTGIGNNGVLAIVVAPNGDVFVVGDFTSAGGSGAHLVAQWDGSSWNDLDTGLVSGGANVAHAVVIGPDGLPYVGGVFATDYGTTVTLNNVGRWSGTAWEALGSGMNSAVYDLAFGPDGRLYAVGSFSTAGGVSANGVAVWNGSKWTALGAGVDYSLGSYAVRSVGFDDQGVLWIGGTFDEAGGVAVPEGVARWNGSSWFPADVDLPGSGGYAYDILGLPTGGVVLGISTYGTAVIAGVN